MADSQIELRTARFDADFRVLTEQFGFRVDMIFPADAPNTAVISSGGVRLRVMADPESQPVTLRLLTDDAARLDRPTVTLPGGTTVTYHKRTTSYSLPPNQPSLVITRNDGSTTSGRAGMLYRDLIPDRWGGRFIASHISIPAGGPVPDYVHFHKVRFQMIFIKTGWAKLVYEDQGEPFVLHAGGCVLQPPEIRHRVLESSAGFEVIEIGCPAEHETIADWALPLPNGVGDPARMWDGQTMVIHHAENATYQPWRLPGWEYRDTGIGAATGGLAGVRVARTAAESDQTFISHDTEFAQLVVLAGAVELGVAATEPVRLTNADSVTLPGGQAYTLVNPTADCELLDVTLPATDQRWPVPHQ